ncbi:MAG TPA: hypothetical protein VEG34_05800, partial [Thermoanaerobaculia bacterium]|nr:hypothetical protein [Thermoanaerobaculia bacterium]
MRGSPATWILLAALAVAPDAGRAAPPQGIKPTRPVPARPPDSGRLARARRLLGADAVAGSLGPYVLYTDLRDPERLAWLGRVAGRFEEAYRVRTGRVPIGAPAEVVVLFAEEADYQSFQREERQLAPLASRGHSGYGIVALWDGGRSRLDLASTLVHELAHLVNRRSLGPLLPSWLDEGIADELAVCEIDEEGRILPGTLSGVRVKAGRFYRVFGARASLLALAQEMEEGRLPPLTRLHDLAWEEFVGSEGGLHYIHAAFWIRYLWDGDGGALAPGLLAFLAGVADGRPATGEALRGHLGRGWPELEAGFRGWLAQQAEAERAGRGDGEPVSPPRHEPTAATESLPAPGAPGGVPSPPASAPPALPARAPEELGRTPGIGGRSTSGPGGALRSGVDSR